MNNSIYKTEKDHAYTDTAWQGKLYDSKNSTKDIAQFIRHFCKKQYPECKFSISKRDFRAIDLILISAPYEIFEKPDIEKIPNNWHGTKEDTLVYWQKSIEKGQHNVNQYYIDNDCFLNEKGKEIMHFLNNCATAYNYDDSDSQTDYFDTNFYYSLAIGKWDKPFTIKK